MKIENKIKRLIRDHEFFKRTEEDTTQRILKAVREELEGKRIIFKTKYGTVSFKIKDGTI